MLWLNFLHLYQPAVSDSYVIEEATRESYEKIIKALENNPRAKFTLNISGCLVERWQELHYFELIERIKALIAKGQVELAGSAAHHCLMPLCPKRETVRQIRDNTKILKAVFGEDLKLRGFFFPEMAYSAAAAKIVKNCGFEWMILDEISLNGHLGQADFHKVYYDRNSKLKAVFRSRDFSSTFVPQFVNRKFLYKDLVITATDGELYGLRHKDRGNELEKALANPQIETKTISEFVDSAKAAEPAALVSSNWEADEEDIRSGNPYFLWLHRDNRIHKKLWELADLAAAAEEKYKRDSNHKWGCYHLSRGLASCTFWWASGHDFSNIFGPKAWNPDMIERGVNQLIRSVRSYATPLSREDKIKAEQLGLAIKQMVWKKHWEEYF